MSRMIHLFVRGRLEFEESCDLLDNILKSEKWSDYLDTELALYHYSKLVNQYSLDLGLKGFKET